MSIRLVHIQKYLLTTVLCALDFSIGSSVFAQKANKTLFTRIQAEESGIEFANLVPENDSMNIIAHPNHWNGGGVAIGDFNNDNLPDIYFTGNNVSDRLYLNKGDLRFDDVTGSSGVDTKGGWKTGVTLVDINKDGWLDIYVCRAGPNNFAPIKSTNLLYLNNGDKTFTESASVYGIDDSGLSIQAVFFDMDNDGDEDLFVVNNNHELSYGSNIYSRKILPEGVNRLYRNNGEGSFEDVSQSAGILIENALSLNAVAADLNNDGLKDIYVSNDLVSSDHVYINLGDGKFEERGREMFKHYCSNAMGSDIADFNNDGLADVLVVDMFPENAERQKNQAGITNDYFESMVRQGHHPQYVRNTLSVNNGNGTFSDVAHITGVAHTDWSWCPLFADFDNDGLKDVLITNSLKKNILDNDFRVYKMDSIMRYVSFNKKTALYKALNRTESLNLENYVFKNEGGFSFKKKMEEWGLNQPINTTSAAYGDLDNDGDLDLVFNNMDTIAWLYKNNTSENGKNSFVRFKASSSTSVQLYSSESVQTQQVIGPRGYQSYPESVLHFGVKPNEKLDSAVVLRNGTPVQTIYDLQPGSEIDILDSVENRALQDVSLENESQELFVLQNNVIRYNHRENRFDDFKREPLLYERHSQPGPYSCKGDYNNDGLEDIYISGALRVPGKLLAQQLDGTFTESVSPTLENHANREDGPCVFFDANDDGFLDLYVSSSGYELQPESELLRDRVYLNQNGSFEWSNELSPSFGSVTSCVKANNTANGVELFVGGGPVPESYPQSSSSHVLFFSEGKMTDVTQEIAPEVKRVGLVKDAVWTDYDNDGRKDLIVVGHWMPISLFGREGKKLIRDKQLSSFKGFWNAIDEADLDGDGDPDYIVGNRGLNTRLQAMKDEPIRIYSSDFDGNGQMDAIQTYYIEGNESLIHTRDALLDQVIDLKKKYLTYRAYAKEPVERLFDSKAIKNSEVFEVNELRSSALINSGTGSFEIQFLPEECQTAPVRTIVTKDIDGNGLEEVILAGNSTDAHFLYGKDQAFNGIHLEFEENLQFNVAQSFRIGLPLNGEITSMFFYEDKGGFKLVAFRQFNKPLVFRYNGLE